MTELERNDLIHVLKSPEGLRTLYNILKQCGVFMESYVDNTNRAYFDKGKRYIGASLWAKIDDVDRDAYRRMREIDDSMKTREEIKLKDKLKKKTLTTIDSSSLPNTGRRGVKEVSHA